jgi:hypothetical protein
MKGRRSLLEIGNSLADGKALFSFLGRWDAGNGEKIEEKARGQIPVIIETAG